MSLFPRAAVRLIEAVPYVATPHTAAKKPSVTDDTFLDVGDHSQNSSLPSSDKMGNRSSEEVALCQAEVPRFRPLYTHSTDELAESRAPEDVAVRSPCPSYG